MVGAFPLFLQRAAEQKKLIILAYGVCECDNNKKIHFVQREKSASEQEAS